MNNTISGNTDVDDTIPGLEYGSPQVCGYIFYFNGQISGDQTDGGGYPDICGLCLPVPPGDTRVILRLILYPATLVLSYA